MLGDECFVGEHAVLGAGVKVYPFKTVEQGAVINSSIVWESRGSRSLFGRVGVAGLANVDITPELATRVAMAFATTLKKDSTIVTSRELEPVRPHAEAGDDGRRQRGRRQRARPRGGVGAGHPVHRAPTRARRRACRSAWWRATRRAASSGSSTPTGADLSEDTQRKVERLFGREDFRRVFPAEIGDIGFPPRALEQYTAALEATVDIESIRAARFKVVVDYAYGSTSFVMPNVLAKLGADILGVNPYASTLGALGFDRQEHAERGRRPRAGLRRPPRGRARSRRGAPHPHRRPRPASSPTTERSWRCCHLVSGHLLGDTVALPVTVTRHAEAIARAHGVRVRRTKLSTPALMDAASEPGVGFAASTDGGFILPGFLPAFDAAASAREGARPPGPAPERACRRSSTALPAVAPRPRDGGDAVGAEGHW